MIEELGSQLLEISRTARVTAGGKHMSFRATIVVGDRKGKVGFGVAKGKDVQEAVERATVRAKKDMFEVPIKDGTIPFDIETKYCSARVLLRNQRQGRGIIAGGTVRVICELAGINNITGKLLSKTRNKINTARATILALKKIKAIKQVGLPDISSKGLAK